MVELNQVPSIYSTLDVLMIGGSCFVLGASLIYLLQADGKTSQSGNWDRLIEGLTGEDERKIVQIIADEGVPSSRASWLKGVASPRVR